MPVDAGPRPDAYRILLVHPTAPTELLAAMYWALAGGLQGRRAAGEHVDDELHHLTRAYQCVADSDRRTEYNASLGLVAQPLTVRPLPPTRRSLLKRLLRRTTHGSIDLYEVMGVARNVPVELLPHAHRIMRDQYLRLRPGKRQMQLLDALERSYVTLRSQEARGRYDSRTSERQNGVSPGSSGVGTAPTSGDVGAGADGVTGHNRPKVSEDLPKAATMPATSPKEAAPKAVSAPLPESSENGEASFPPRGRSSARALRLLSRAAGFVLLAIAAGFRVSYRASVWGVNRLRGSWQDWRSRRATRTPATKPRPAPTQPPLPPVAHTPSDRVKRAPSEVEEKFLGRVATSVRESESHLHGVDPNLGSGKSP